MKKRRLPRLALPRKHSKKGSGHGKKLALISCFLIIAGATAGILRRSRPRNNDDRAE